MLTERNCVDSDLISENRFVDNVANHLGVRKRHTPGVMADIAKGVQA